MAQRVLGVLYPDQEVCPVVLPTTAVCPEEPVGLLDGALCLIIRLRVVPGGQADRGLYLLDESFPDPRDKLWATI